MSTVTEQKFLSEEELASLKEIQSNTQALIAELGEIELVKLQLENRHDAAKKFLTELGTKEQEFTKEIFEKYGKASIDPKTGEITLVD
jgi:hypothetical protein